MRAGTIARTAPLAVLLLLGGCISFGPKAPPTLFDLTAENPAPAGAGQSGTLASALVVEVPDAPLELNVTRIPVQIDASNLAYVENAGWVERPARLFHRLLAETIRARGSRLVLESEPGTGASEVLSGRLLAMGFDAPSNSAVVRFDAMRATRGGQVQVRRFEVVQGASAKPEVLGPALNRAANDVARQVAEWVG
ncbi:MAG: ABC-type transport auxiliary lipoprotein family protein [Novosphingobium sp.]|nr:ABC-type transport auxiliary lipoprotein family protein [Novosphingobium sp.]